jgi:hydrogenase 3 maturation protease
MKISNPFRSIIQGKTLFFGIGSTLRGDDGIGPLLVQKLQGKINAVCINAENAPEKFIGKIIKEKPDTLLIVDAVHLNATPGSYAILPPEEIQNSCFSTHDIPMGMLIVQLQAEINAKIHVIGVQPQSIAFGIGLSEKVSQTLNSLCEMIIDASKNTNKE